MPWGCCQSMLWLLTHRGHLMAQTTGGRLLTGICTSSSYINLAMCSSLLHSHLHLKMCRVLSTRKDRWERHPGQRLTFQQLAPLSSEWYHMTDLAWVWCLHHNLGACAGLAVTLVLSHTALWHALD